MHHFDHTGYETQMKRNTDEKASPARGSFFMGTIHTDLTGKTIHA
jgi:hypothetical protein